MLDRRGGDWMGRGVELTEFVWSDARVWFGVGIEWDICEVMGHRRMVPTWRTYPGSFGQPHFCPHIWVLYEVFQTGRTFGLGGGPIG